MPTPDRYTAEAPAECDVAIVGGGFSGLMSLVRLAQCAPKCQAVVLERRPLPGPGVAYGACDAEHLLNVPAARMGVFAERPTGFHEWLERNFPGRYRADEFVPRALFGRYLAEAVSQTLADTKACAAFVRDAVVHIEPLGQRFELLLASGRTVLARGVILAPGLPPARAPWRAVDEGVTRSLVAQDPWDRAAVKGLAPDGDAVLVGSGLTAIDLVMGLRRSGWKGRIVLVSRNGRLPLPHAASHGAPVVYDPQELMRGVHAAFRAVRRAAKELARVGHDWRAAIDAVRPHAQAVWGAWPASERQAFLRRLRPFWEIHRHRAPAHLLEAIERERAAGTIEVVAGAIASLRMDAASTHAEVVVRTAHGSLRVIRASRVINCSGPAMSVSETLDPLLGSLLRMGFALADRLGLGLRTDREGRLIGADGTVQRRVRLVGALRRGELWESTAVPELRAQAAVAAESLAQELGCGTVDRRAFTDRSDSAPRGAIGGCA
ncbi:MAG: hypothetical protein GC172_13040 [Phycisphaera sp.]|nr:hypothetical protein [Phycisphaera sp.]